MEIFVRNFVKMDSTKNFPNTQDPNAKVACESVTKTGMVMVCGEITSKAEL